MTRTFDFHDWREVARILNLAHRFGCALESLEVRRRDGLFGTTVAFTGDENALRRLDAQFSKITEDDKEMAR